MNRYYLAFLLLSSINNAILVEGQGDPLRQPPVIESASNGVLDMDLAIEYGTINGPFFSLTNTRLFNGMLPGPTLRLDAGDTLKIRYENKLEEQAGTSFGENELTNPDHSNLHYHGAHVSGELPSDDVRFVVAPGDAYQYETDFPGNHMPGTHWIHPHAHGSSTIQVGGGAAMALIVNDPPGFLPSQVEDAQDVLLFVQHMDLQELDQVISNYNDRVFGLQVDNTNGAPLNFRIVNGQYQPVLSMQPGEWQRWRIVMAGWLGNELDFSIDSNQCEMHLLSKDGIYIQDFPRQLSVLPIPAGGRADVMVRCNSAGTYNVMDFGPNPLMTINVAGTPVPSSTTLQAWTPTYPSYLKDLQNTPADPGCSCPTAFNRCNGRRNLLWWLFGGGGGGGNWDGDNDGDEGGNGGGNWDGGNNGGGGGGNWGGNNGGGGGNWDGGNNGGGGGGGNNGGGGGNNGGGGFNGGGWNGGGNGNRRTCINGQLFDEHVYIHTVAFGSVVERHLTDVVDHPYHQHVYPFQVISSSTIRDGAHAAYYQVGDWQDTIQLGVRDVAVRYRADVHDGTIMLHCHILEHEDLGTMAQEIVVDGGECSCNAFATISSGDTTVDGFSPTRESHGGISLPEELTAFNDITISAEQLSATSHAKGSFLMTFFAAAVIPWMTVFLLT